MMDCFNETDRRNRLMTLHTLKAACTVYRDMSEDEQAWCRIRQRIYQREITVLANWKQFSYDEQCSYAWEFDYNEA